MGFDVRFLWQIDDVTFSAELQLKAVTKDTFQEWQRRKNAQKTTAYAKKRMEHQKEHMKMLDYVDDPSAIYYSHAMTSLHSPMKKSIGKPQNRFTDSTVFGMNLADTEKNV